MTKYTTVKSQNSETPDLPKHPKRPKRPKRPKLTKHSKHVPYHFWRGIEYLPSNRMLWSVKNVCHLHFVTFMKRSNVTRLHKYNACPATSRDFTSNTCTQGMLTCQFDEEFEYAISLGLEAIRMLLTLHRRYTAAAWARGGGTLRSPKRRFTSCLQ